MRISHERPLALADRKNVRRHVAASAALLAATASVLGCSFIAPNSDYFAGGSGPGPGQGDTGSLDSSFGDEIGGGPDVSGADVAEAATDDVTTPADEGPVDTKPEVIDTCANKLQDVDEVDVDCGGGGRCARCADGKRCVAATDCASNRCYANQCVAEDACIPGSVCAIQGSDCLVGRLACGNGTSVCEVAVAAPSGTKCTGGFCDGAGSCKPCETGNPCVPNNACHTGIQNCQNGASQCLDTGNLLPEGSYCGLDRICSTLGCVAANGVISRGEDPKITTGGEVFSFASAGAKISPEVSGQAVFPPDPGGRVGKGLRVTGEMPPIDAANGIYPTAGLGMRFTPLERSYDASGYQGIEFWAKADENMTLRVFMVDVLTDSEYSFCSISDESTVIDRCFNYPMAECDILTTWTVCRIPWSDFKRENWGNAGAGLNPDTKRLTIFQLNPPHNTGTETYKFGFTVDDVRLLTTL